LFFLLSPVFVFYQQLQLWKGESGRWWWRRFAPLAPYLYWCLGFTVLLKSIIHGYATRCPHDMERCCFHPNFIQIHEQQSPTSYLFLACCWTILLTMEWCVFDVSVF
jgi:hypothetical protein